MRKRAVQSQSKLCRWCLRRRTAPKGVQVVVAIAAGRGAQQRGGVRVAEREGRRLVVIVGGRWEGCYKREEGVG